MARTANGSYKIKQLTEPASSRLSAPNSEARKTSKNKTENNARSPLMNQRDKSVLVRDWRLLPHNPDPKKLTFLSLSLLLVSVTGRVCFSSSSHTKQNCHHHNESDHSSRIQKLIINFHILPASHKRCRSLRKVLLGLISLRHPRRWGWHLPALRQVALGVGPYYKPMWRIEFSSLKIILSRIT